MLEMIIPRNIEIVDVDEIEIMGFCNASERAYGCTVYVKLQSVYKGQVHGHLLRSKSRLNSIDLNLTIPKLMSNYCWLN